MVTHIYFLTREFPSNEQFGLTSQITRSAVSIPSNIAEGFGRQSKKEFAYFLLISLSSLFEMQTQLEICKKVKILKEIEFVSIYESSREVERMLSSFIRTLKK